MTYAKRIFSSLKSTLQVRFAGGFDVPEDSTCRRVRCADLRTMRQDAPRASLQRAGGFPVRIPSDWGTCRRGALWTPRRRNGLIRGRIAIRGWDYLIARLTNHWRIDYGSMARNARVSAFPAVGFSFPFSGPRVVSVLFCAFDYRADVSFTRISARSFSCGRFDARILAAVRSAGLTTGNQHRRLTMNIKRNILAIITIGIFTFGVSPVSHAAGDAIKCSSRVTPENYQIKLRAISIEPNNRIYKYIAGIYGLCLGKTQEGMGHIQRSAEMGHVQAHKVMAEYYRSDGSLDGVKDRHRITKDQQNFDNAVHYYRKTFQLIESNPAYPRGANRDQRSLERQALSSASVFYWLTYLYYTGYARALDEIVNSDEKLHYEDSLDILDNMGDISQACLNWPTLSEWKERKQRVSSLLKSGCSAMKDFVDTVWTLEQERIDVSGKCRGALRGCAEHQRLMKQIRSAENDMLRRLDANPPIF